MREVLSVADRLPRSARHTPPYSRLPDGCCRVSPLDPCLLVEFLSRYEQGAPRNNRDLGPSVGKHLFNKQKGQQAKKQTENRVGHHKRQHSASVLESREQSDY